jgi:dihydropyrimidinase
MNLLLQSGTIVTSEKTEVADILIKNGTISEIGVNIAPPENTTVINALEKYIIPGGIDPHVHMCLPTPAKPSSDDFLSGSIAALYGGTTTILDFVTPKKGQSLLNALEKRKKEASVSLTDYSFHVSPVEWTKTTEEEIKECVKQGITSFKVYLAYLKTVGLQDEDFLKVLKTVGKTGGVVTVHCELGNEIEKLQNNFANENLTTPEFHALSRPAIFESDAVKKAIEMANEANCPLYIVHVSAKESLKHIENAQKKGQKVFAETCPHYLLLDDSKYIGNFNQTAPYVISPPLRKKEDNEALWNAISKGNIQTIGTDHCPFNLKQKAVGINDFRKIPNGAGGVEHRLELLYTYGILKNKINLNQWVNICSTQPSKIFGLYPAKGEIAIGSDADIVIWNPNSENVISAKTHHQNCDSNIFEGIKTKGFAEFVIKNGNVVIENGKLITPSEQGKFLKR